MNILKHIICCAALCSTVAMAQENYTVSGVILNELREPVADAVLTAPGKSLVRTASDGSFVMHNLSKWSVIRVQAKGF